MKKILYLLFLSVLSSCSGDFLRNYPVTSLNEGNFYQTESQYILLANGCYVPMRDYEKEEHWVISEVASDNGSFQYNPTGSSSYPRQDIDEFLATSSNENYAGFWKDSYNGITRCNKLLSEMDRPGVSWSKASYKERCSGEALFLRALYYFNLVRQFGGVPLVTEPITSIEAVGIKRSTDVQIYDQIIADLKLAVTHFTNAKDVEENGRANLGAANSLLGKVLLTLHKYDEAEPVLKSVIDSKTYDLLAKYADVFNPSVKDYKETIFGIQYSENSVALSQKFIFWFAPWTSAGDVTLRPKIKNNSALYGWNQPTDDLINAFEAGDQRKAVAIGFWNGKDWDGVKRLVPYCAKYKAPISAPDARCGDNLPVIRYSDVLLMYAEVLNELGRLTEALPYVLKVRQRAGLMNALTGYDKTTLAALIAKERQVELCFENQRWYDLKRTGKALEVMAAHGIREKAKKTFLYPNSFEMSEFKLLAPIPVDQVYVNKIDQNPGY